MKRSIRLISTIATLTAACFALASAELATADVFTYQGELRQGGEAVNDNCDFRFTLWTASTGGSQVGPLVQVLNQPLSDGRVTADLDFGASAFNGSNRWIQIQVRCPAGNGEYIMLTPRQPVRPTPYAMKSLGNTMSWMDGSGNTSTQDAVGIGTNSPDAELHVVGDNATLKLEDSDNPGGYTLIEDPQPTQLRISKTNTNGDVLLDLNPKPANGIGTGLVRFFRETNSTGVKGIRFYRGNNTLQLSALIGVDGQNSAFQLHGGNLGIGTASPEGPLHVFAGSAGNVAAQASSSAVFERSGQNFISILSPNASERGILFGDPESAVNGGVIYNNPSNPDGFQFRTGNNVNRMVITRDGNVGVGNTGASTARLSASASTTVAHAFSGISLDSVQPTIVAVNVGSGGALWAQGTSDASLGGGGLIMAGTLNSSNIAIDSNEIMARNNGAASTLLINREGGNVAIGSASGGSSTLSTPVLQITGGSDFSEMFDVGGDLDIQPGMVVVIDPANPGRLMPATTAYDRKVAGVISGAGGVATGMRMGHDGTIADGDHPVALTGRVYCMVDASECAIEPGDMLTTSDTPGHAMKAADLALAQGAIIGKAMTSLKQGETGLVLVLVNLQ
ncbi:MAG: hypothetical protein ACR2GY_13040 [Phycisphaerales bacterium]